jgi:hypothetical protein
MKTLETFAKQRAAEILREKIPQNVNASLFFTFPLFFDKNWAQ